MQDSQTIAVYDKQVKKYADLVSTDSAGAILQGFMDTLPQGGYVLDLGCGPGNSSALLQTQGFRTDPVDASAEMVKHANDTYNLNARKATFDDLKETSTYDGIWANFSLLHAPKADFPRYLNAIHDALIDDGVFHIGMKLGTGMMRDSIGRMYAYYSEDELTEHLTKAGFVILDKTYGEEPGLSGEIAPWITILAKR